MKKYLFVLSAITIQLSVSAQVGIGTENPKATLHIAEDLLTKKIQGLIPPRVPISKLNELKELYSEEHHGTIVFVTSIDEAASNKTQKVTDLGYYYYHQPTANIVGEWRGIGGQKSNASFFYMPSIVFDTKIETPNGDTWKRNLYLEYKAQFTNKTFVPDYVSGGTLSDVASNTFVKSTGAPNAINTLPNATDLYYYVTDYDKTAIEVLNISEEGILEYKVIGTGTDYSFINIVFVEK